MENSWIRSFLLELGSTVKVFCTCLSACFEIHVLWSKIIFLLPIGWGFKESNLFSEIYEVDTKALICFERDYPNLYQKSRQLIAKYTLIIYLIHECREKIIFGVLPFYEISQILCLVFVMITAQKNDVVIPQNFKMTKGELRLQVHNLFGWN